MNRGPRAAIAGLLAVCGLAGCASDDYYDSPGSVSTHTSFYYGSGGWYGYPYYYYDDPDYIVTPPDRPLDPGARPENPIAEVPPGERPRPTPLPAERPPSAEQLPKLQDRPADSSRSRMPSAKPRTSTPRSRPSIPSRPRGGFSRGGGGRRR